MVNPVVGFQNDMPPQGFPVLEGQAEVFTYPWYSLLLTLFERTGGGNGIPLYNSASVSDAGGSQTTATPLIPILNFVTASGKGVRLPAEMGPGEFCIVVNVTPSAALDVYPAPGGQINVLGVNAPYVMNAGGAIAFPTVQIFWYKTALQCYATKLG